MKNYIYISFLLLAVLPFKLVMAKQDVSFVTFDGVTIVGSYYQPQKLSSSAVLLLPMLSRTRSSWNDFAEFLHLKGFAVLSIDMRGHGESTRSSNGNLDYRKFEQNDFQSMTQDVASAVKWLKAHSEIDSNHISIVGASIGSNVALNYAVTDSNLDKVVMLSPGLNYRGVQTEAAIKSYGNRWIMLVAAEDDSYSAITVKTLKDLCVGPYTVELYEKGGHGNYLFGSQADLNDKILNFLQK